MWNTQTSVTFKYSVRTAQKTLRLAYINTNQLMVHREITASPQSYKTHINILCGQTEEFLNAVGGVH